MHFYLVSLHVLKKPNSHGEMQFLKKKKLTGSAEVPAKVELQLNVRIPELNMSEHYQLDRNDKLQLWKLSSLSMICYEY